LKRGLPNGLESPTDLLGTVSMYPFLYTTPSPHSFASLTLRRAWFPYMGTNTVLSPSVSEGVYATRDTELRVKKKRQPVKVVLLGYSALGAKPNSMVSESTVLELTL
jgi:hypothetical protein